MWVVRFWNRLIRTHYCTINYNFEQVICLLKNGIWNTKNLWLQLRLLLFYSPLLVLHFTISQIQKRRSWHQKGMQYWTISWKKNETSSDKTFITENVRSHWCVARILTRLRFDKSIMGVKIEILPDKNYNSAGVLENLINL